MDNNLLQGLTLLVAFLQVDMQDFCISNVVINDHTLSFNYRDKDEYIVEQYERILKNHRLLSSVDYINGIVTFNIKYKD